MALPRLPEKKVRRKLLEHKVLKIAFRLVATKASFYIWPPKEKEKDLPARWDRANPSSRKAAAQLLEYYTAELHALAARVERGPSPDAAEAARRA